MNMSWISAYSNFPKDVFNFCSSFLVPSAKQITSNIETKMDLSFVVKQFNSSPWVKVAALAGASAVVMGAYGAHGLKNDSKRAIFQTGNHYHMYHSLAMLACPFLKKPSLTGFLFLGGIIIFSGTCYWNAITNNDQIIRFTPVGGFMLIFAWLSILI